MSLVTKLRPKVQPSLSLRLEPGFPGYENNAVSILREMHYLDVLMTQKKNNQKQEQELQQQPQEQKQQQQQ